jgi:hypothetical protein
MANRLQHLRGSEAEHSTFTGAKGEISLVTDTSANRIPTGEVRIHDGTTAGGLHVTGAARAWVNFNGTGTVAIRAAYNVSSITENGGSAGNYTVNFATAMPDSNYVAVGNHNVPSAGAASVVFGYDYPAYYSTTQLQLTCFYGTVGYRVDSSRVTVAVFR